jgi:hypothetical protein
MSILQFDLRALKMTSFGGRIMIHSANPKSSRQNLGASTLSRNALD